MSSVPPHHEAGIRTAAGDLRFGRVTGRICHDPLRIGPGGGRARRWYYVAAGGAAADGTTVVTGAAIVQVGPLVVAFAYLTLGERTVAFDARLPGAAGRMVGATPDEGARFRTRSATLEFSGDGSYTLEVPTDGGRLSVTTRTHDDVLPVALVTRTPGGGWNVTQKAAGTGASLQVYLGGRPVSVADATGWRDWTAGRQDRRTSWRWAAGAGHTTDGTRIGLNASTGMNAGAEGEDLVWIDGVPQPLEAVTLGPDNLDELAGAWRITGHRTSLELSPVGVRSQHERLGPLVSAYAQPIGRWRGTLTPAGGDPRSVTLFGVAEDHSARW